MQNLVVVESPTKARTLQRFLGSEYQIEASMGHVRDLPKSEFGVDVEKNFEPQYVIPRDKRKRENEQTVKRVVFHEITEEAVKKAFEEPRDIDSKLVDAQQTRRILDRLVG